MLKPDAFAPDLACQGAAQLSCGDLHQLNIYHMDALLQCNDVCVSASLFSLTRDDLKNQTALSVTW